LPWLQLDKARALDGRKVRAGFGVAKPPDFAGGRTVLGCADQPDGVERVVVLRGEYPDVSEGGWKVVEGWLSVTDHPAPMVNGFEVPAWPEIWVEGELVVRPLGEPGEAEVGPQKRHPGRRPLDGAGGIPRDWYKPTSPRGVTPPPAPGSPAAPTPSAAA